MEEALDALREYAGVFIFALALTLAVGMFAKLADLNEMLYYRALNTHNYYFSVEVNS